MHVRASGFAGLAAFSVIFGGLLLYGGDAAAQASPSSSTSCDGEVTDGCSESVGNVTGENSSTAAQQQATVIRGQVGNAVRYRLLNLRNHKTANRTTWIAGTDSDSIVDDVAAWVNYGYRYTETSPTDQNTTTDLHAATLGFDTSLWGRLVIGLSASMSRGKSDAQTVLAANASTISDIQQRTRTISPYIGLVVTDNIYMDAAVGVSDENVQNDIRTEATGTALSRFIQNGRTRFGFVDVNYVREWEDWTFTGITGLLRSVTQLGDARDQVNAAVVFPNRQSTSTLWTLGVQATYNYKNNFFPYAGITYERSLTDRPIGLATGQVGLSGNDLQTNDTSNFRFTLGCDWTPETLPSLVLSVEADAVAARRDFGEVGATFNLRHTF